MQIDLHGYHPVEIVWSGVLAKLVEQAWEMGERELILIHGHGRNRGITPGFVNTNTGFFGLQIRSALRHDKDLRRWIHHTTLDCSNPRSYRCVLEAQPLSRPNVVGFEPAAGLAGEPREVSDYAGLSRSSRHRPLFMLPSAHIYCIGVRSVSFRSTISHPAYTLSTLH
jgi:hypothetical protein